MHIFFAETNDKQENISHTAPRVHRCIRFSLHINMNNQKYIGLKWIRNSSNTKSLKLANFSANYSYLGYSHNLKSDEKYSIRIDIMIFGEKKMWHSYNSKP